MFDGEIWRKVGREGEAQGEAYRRSLLGSFMFAAGGAAENQQYTATENQQKSPDFKEYSLTPPHA